MKGLPKDTTMDIYAKPGDRVRFKYPFNGYDPDIERAKVLKLDTVYTVDFVHRGSSHTDVYLKEFPGIRFNSCMFSDVKKRKRK